MELRPYQKDAMEAITQAWESGADRVLLVLPTGTGKTVVFSKIVEQEVRAGGRVLILAHRGELLQQAADKLYRVCGVRAGLEQAKSHAVGTPYRVILGSQQTLCRRKRREAYPPDYFTKIIVDEAHRTLSPSYLHILGYFSGAKVLGVTATPDRGDGKGLGQYYQCIAYEYSLYEAIHDRYLVPIRAKVLPVNLDLRGVEMEEGDYALSGVGAAIEPYLENIADQMVQYCKDRRTVVFLPLIRTAEKFRDILTKCGFRAIAVSSETDKQQRARILQDVESGKYNVVCNSMLLVEGWDCPPIDCVVILRATKSRSLYCQMVGRGTRLCDGKDHLLLLDFLWNTDQHDLCEPASLTGANDEIRAGISKRLAQTDEPEDIFDAERDAKQDREQALASKLEEHKDEQAAEIDPVHAPKIPMQKKPRKLVRKAMFLKLNGTNFGQYIPESANEAMPMTEKQANFLKQLGLDPQDIETKGEAGYYIHWLSDRQKSGLATPGQMQALAWYYGYCEPRELAQITKAQAAEIMNKRKQEKRQRIQNR